MAMYVTRVMGFPHGIGLMGGFRLKKNGPYRGMFAVQENGMQTLSTAVSAFALLKGLSAESTPQRIREILWKREMNVEMAERLLLAWHHMNELCLTGESGVHPDWSNAAPHHLEPDLLNEAEREILRGSIETVASAQRYVGQIFSGMEE
jgi:signal-transduction protein with cAMP-binding, CBS, and nucleotidyltransferase domain